MKIPKTLCIFGYDWKVKVVKSTDGYGGGSFSWKTRSIEIKKDGYKEMEVILLHEIIEAVMVHNLARYYGQEGNSEYHFFFNHTQFTKIIYDIFQVLKDNKLI